MKKENLTLEDMHDALYDYLKETERYDYITALDLLVSYSGLSEEALEFVALNATEGCLTLHEILDDIPKDWDALDEDEIHMSW